MLLPHGVRRECGRSAAVGTGAGAGLQCAVCGRHCGEWNCRRPFVFLRMRFVIRCARNDCAKKIARGCRAERLDGRVGRGNRAGEIGVCSRKTFARAIYILFFCAHKRFFAPSVKFFAGEVLRADSVRIRLASRCYLRRRGGARLYGADARLHGTGACLSVFVLQKCNPRCGAGLYGLECV